MASLHKTRGIVLHTLDYGNTSVIVKIYTELFGLQTYVVNHVRSAKAKGKAGYFQPLSLLNLVVYHHPEKGLQRISTFSFEQPLSSIMFNVVKSTQAIFMAELLYRTIHEEEANPALFDFINQAVVRLDRLDHQDADFHLHFMIQLATLLGFAINPQKPEGDFVFDLKEGCFTTKKVFHPYVAENDKALLLCKLINHDGQLLLHHHQRLALLDLLLQYYRIHLPDGFKLQSVEVLNEVFGS
jgi:DNA repair protein RecO (recombination protein O)